MKTKTELSPKAGRAALLRLRAACLAAAAACDDLLGGMPGGAHEMALRVTLAGVAARYGYTLDHLRSAARTAHLSEARHVAAYVARERHGVNLSEIGRQLNRDHGSILHALRRVRGQMSVDAAFRARVAAALGDAVTKQAA